jgi:hypothetical protein
MPNNFMPSTSSLLPLEGLDFDIDGFLSSSQEVSLQDRKLDIIMKTLDTLVNVVNAQSDSINQLMSMVRDLPTINRFSSSSSSGNDHFI